MLVINLYALHHVSGNSSFQELLKPDQLSSDEQLARSYILDVIAGSLSALLLPVYTLKTSVTDYFAPSNDKTVPGVADERLGAPGFFATGTKASRKLKFTDEFVSGDDLKKLRAVRIIELGRLLTEYQVSGSNLITLDSGEFVSTTNNSINNKLLKELKEFTLRIELQEIADGAADRKKDNGKHTRNHTQQNVFVKRNPAPLARKNQAEYRDPGNHEALRWTRCLRRVLRLWTSLLIIILSLRLILSLCLKFLAL
ncbi:hypothetical protein KQX54_001186 [Cotesia glomerata]|uniref:Uncharacterized protein n=1 Tax=Cotesia glomerata TaxID=32391 RepID=A0AAV7IPZ0_COTGL|nr:hypothetical protein KQX54_001186 [Cotesia glomerata]